MANLLIWWRQRTPSEQRLLLGLTGLLAACAFWYGLWQPWRAREAQWRQTLVKEQASLRWMTEQAPRLQQLSQQPAPAAKEALTALVMREAASHGLTVIRLQPQGKRLQITLQPCAFQALIDWLERSGDARRQRNLAVRDRAAVATRLGHGQPSAAGARR